LGRGTGQVGEGDKEKEVQDAGEDEAAGSGGVSPQKTGRAVPPAQDGALPHRAIPGVDEELGHGGVRVVPVQDADPGTPAQALQEVEDAAEDDVGRSSKATERDKDRFTVRDLMADERCTRAVLDFLRTKKVGSKVGQHAAPPKPGEEGKVAREGAEEMEAGRRA